MNQNTENIGNQQQESNDSRPANENAGFYLSTMIKITDPNTKEVLVQMRGDN
jgi:hypothetical protein